MPTPIHKKDLHRFIRQVLDNVALDDGSENIVLLTNVMFSELVLYGIKELTTTHSVIEVIRSKHTL